MKKIKMAVVIIMLGTFLTACSNLKDDMLSIIQQETSNKTNQTTNDNWEENINCRYKAALISNDRELLKECLEDGADINDLDGLSPVYLAITRKNYEMAKYLFDLGASPNWSHNNGYTILHYLSDSTHYDECKMLLEYGADVNFVDGKGMSEIDYAATKIVASLDIFQLLVEHGANVTKNTLKEAINVSNRECDVVRFLLQELLKTGENSGLEPIVEAAILGNTDKVNQCIGKDIKSLSSKDKELVIRYTAAFGNVETMELLDEKGISYKNNKYNFIISSDAIENGNLSVTKFFVENNIIDLGDTAMYPLTLAIHYNQYNIVKYFIEQGANVNLQEYSADNEREAAINGNIKLLDLLIQNGYKLYENNTLFYIISDSALNGKMKILQYFTERNELKNVNNDGETPLESAGLYNINIVKFLVEQGFNVNGYNDSGYPLETCVEFDNTENALYLINQGADVNIFCDGTFLMSAIENGNLTIIKALIEHGADINAPDYGLYPIVQSAVGRTILKYLIDNRADINVQNEESGTSALIMAAYYGNVEGIKILLDAGADITLKDCEGQTAYDNAKAKNHTKCMELLKEAETKEQVEEKQQ